MASKQQGSSGPQGFLLGKLLVALPGMSDPRFEQSVIFMCAHSDEGAMGLIVNKPFEGLTFREMVEKLDLAVSPDATEPPILFGGPVGVGQGFVLHSSEYASAGATMPVTSEISLTATIDILRAMAEGRGPRHAVFALGYAGWGPGQIEGELSSNGWIPCEADRRIVFGRDCDGKWRAALATLGADISGLSAEAGRA
ncbi:MAG: YqgE/AlgH family protein [Alphaproteobacteria bacterium]|nr:YqgE/AlgH family protein [Alphaproteobacteria bacterium]MBV9693267.1 YqgE/AlgH family protein [Alphaproteobacteria bacterium]